MKRSALTRKTPLARKAPPRAASAALSRKEPLAKGEGLKRTPKAQKAGNALVRRAAQEGWAKGVRSKPCAVCKRKGGSVIIDAHHIVAKAELRQIAKTHKLDPDRLLWDARNRMPLCRGCHSRHHAAVRRISLDRLPPKVFQFVRELDRLYDGHDPVTAWLERIYVAVDDGTATGRHPVKRREPDER